MPVVLSELTAARRTAVLTMEIQRGVVGDRSSFPELAAAASARRLVPNTALLLAAARAAGVAVVHCTVDFRADRRGTPSNAPLMTAMLRRPEHLLEGTDPVELVPELHPEPTDIVCVRHHGVSPFTGTGLDPTLRAFGVSTVVATGVSLNVAIIGLAIEAVNLGYQVVIPTDAVAGVPAEYGEQVLAHTLGLVATLTTVDDLIGAWTAGAGPTP